MISTTFIQIGDIHYPDINMNVPTVDVKDEHFPQKLLEMLPPSAYNEILKRLLIELDKGPKAIFFSGDLTSRGQVEGYKNCLQFLKEKIPPDYLTATTIQRLFIVPGNHDVDRSNISKEGLLLKFRSINRCIEEIKFPKIPISDIVTENFNKNPPLKILLIGINSCYGCGEIEYIPDEIKDKFLELFGKIDKGNDESNIKLLNDLNNKLDTPLISNKDIDEMINYINDYGRDYLPIILIHHNILPQNRPRIALYTELLNSGYFRDKLLTLNRPILLLHGHLHDDPVEVIISPKNKYSKIICISAPLLFPNIYDDSKNFGYNKIKIISSDDGQPIGCELEYHRFKSTSIIKTIEKINFWTPPDSIVFSSTEDKRVLSLITDQKQYLKNIIEKNKVSDQPINEDLLINSIEKLTWLGLVIRTNDEGPLYMTCVEKVCP